VKVLVTGATVPIGRAIVRRLLAEPTVEAVLAVGLENDPPLDGDARLHQVAVDLTRTRAVHDLLFGRARELGIDAVVHGVLHRDASASGARWHRLNVDVTRELVLLAERHPTITSLVMRSTADVYRVDHREPNLLDEDTPLALGPATPAATLDRIEADLAVLAHLASPRLRVVVLRLAEIFAPDVGSQLADYLRSRVCLRPMGQDPMVNLLSLEDAADAIWRALASDRRGVYNVAGRDTLPLSQLIASAGRLNLPVPGPLLGPLYRLRARVLGTQYRYELHASRWRFGALLDDRKARRELLA
jgi:UDP-glucose 4-epimerase